MAKTVKEVLDMGKNVKMVDLRFIDVPGTWQHFTIPAHRLDAEFFEEGIPFDGSSIRGFQEIHESDMLLLLDPETAFIDPVAEIPTLVISCDVHDPITRQPYSRDARYVAKKAEAYRNRPASGIHAILAQKPNSSFSIMSVTPAVPMNPFTPLIVQKAGGTAAMPPNKILAARSCPSAAISRSPQRTLCRHCAARLSWRSKSAAWRWNSTTMRWLPPVRLSWACALIP